MGGMGKKVFFKGMNAGPILFILWSLTNQSFLKLLTYKLTLYLSQSLKIWTENHVYFLVMTVSLTIIEAFLVLQIKSNVSNSRNLKNYILSTETKTF